MVLLVYILGIGKDLLAKSNSSDTQGKDPEEEDNFINNNLVDDIPWNDNAENYDEEMQDNSSENIKDSKSMKMMLDSMLELCQLTLYKDVQLICNNGSVFANSLLLSSFFPIIKEILSSLTESETDTTTIFLPDVKVSELETFLGDIYKKQNKIQVCMSINDMLSSKLKRETPAHTQRTIDHDYIELFNDTFDFDENEDDVQDATSTIFIKSTSDETSEDLSLIHI